MMGKRLVILVGSIFLVLVLAALPFVGACAKTAPEEIRVGCTAPLTGMYAGFGESAVFGMQAAVDDINEQGGVYVEEYGKKLPVKLVVINNESDPIKAGTLAEDLIVNEKVLFLLSPDMSCSMHNPVSIIADRYKTPHIIGGGPLEPWMGARMEVEGHWEYTWFPGFAIATPPPEGDFRYGKPGYTIQDTWFQELDAFAGQTNKVAGVFASDEADGRGWYALFPGLLEDYGLSVIGEEKELGMFPLGTTDFSSIINEWKDNEVEILWGNCPGADFGVMWRQCAAMDFKPKMVAVGRAALFYVDVDSWGGNLPQGIGTEIWWAPEYDCPGIGGTTPQTLTERWVEETGQPLSRGIGHGYGQAQILFDAIERAGTLNGEAVNTAIGETDMMTINYRCKFDPETHFSRIPLFFGQWQKTDKPWVWECPIVFSKHDFLPASADPIFPIPNE
jgi:branched-chain amino acid transport system substrate-binding protein